MEPDDVRHAAQWFATELRGRPESGFDYDQPARGLEWSCWYTAEHVADNQLAYALQLAGRLEDGYLPLTPPGEGPNLLQVDRAAGAEGLARTLEAMAQLLAGQVQLLPATARAWHPDGMSDAGGFAAMGVCEVVIHAWDVLSALDDEVADLPEDLCEGVLARLFPGTPEVGTFQDRLLWQTGREELAGYGRLTSWRWDPTVR
ncbi:maleylpyruvate isomerase N-terminal domain-containing protein [Georgenia sp. SUBG003]|uniref:maleylpyruvate isomerase N-terminal domain-containing protein n=1 Tax=Georgenia sp. SUBG003 TaxID=1497974 RepID=UPI0006935D29